MKYKETTIRIASRDTVKDSNGSYKMREADISLTVEAEEGKLDEIKVINRVKELIELAKNGTPIEDKNDPSTKWLNEKQPNEPGYVKKGDK